MKKLDFQISKITEVKNPIYYGDDFLHLYIHTEQASYIQFFCLDLFYYVDNINELLACILNKETRADYSFREWIVNTEFKEISIHELVIQTNGLINQLDMILNESPASLSAKLLKEHLCTLNFENTTNSYEILGCSKIVPNSPDEGGPNYQFFWENKGNFYFLHIHLES
ncbi:hypothetical protein KTI78_10780 [Acinetobacter sp. WU_MDCI_Abxe161]|uniref:hypothetical protein n=1 Tax=Acinetobacter sp. WU_MDCI_Abxe161 TaxID=2850074 RepID=UPI0021CD4FBC|nr:hypothetical protein [Acinetobacter sp. WU_MDCI_Abxe161]MCU4503649.1 hypothetical protein [Acinetobacter sp. WU_MDCI_Abxe161]